MIYRNAICNLYPGINLILARMVQNQNHYKFINLCFSEAFLGRYTSETTSWCKSKTILLIIGTSGVTVFFSINIEKKITIFVFLVYRPIKVFTHQTHNMRILSDKHDIFNKKLR